MEGVEGFRLAELGLETSRQGLAGLRTRLQGMGVVVLVWFWCRVELKGGMLPPPSGDASWR